MGYTRRKNNLRKSKKNRRRRRRGGDPTLSQQLTGLNPNSMMAVTNKVTGKL
jgi:hypothetical protein